MNTKLVVLAAVLTLSASANAASRMDPKIQDLLVETCSHAQADDRISLNNTLKANRLSKQRAVDKVVCDGQTLVNFARNANASKVVAMLAPYERDNKGKVIISDVVAAP